MPNSSKGSVYFYHKRQTLKPRQLPSLVPTTQCSICYTCSLCLSQFSLIVFVLFFLPIYSNMTAILSDIQTWLKIINYLSYFQIHWIDKYRNQTSLICLLCFRSSSLGDMSQRCSQINSLKHIAELDTQTCAMTSSTRLLDLLFQDRFCYDCITT